MVLPIGLCISTIVQFIHYVPAVKKTGFKWTPKIRLKDRYLKNMLYLAIPIIFGVSVSQIGTMIDKNLATFFMPIGGYAITGYASRLSEFVNGIVVVSIGTVAYTALSESSAARDIKKFKITIFSSINSMNILVLPATVGLIVFAKPIVQLVYGRGSWKASATDMTAIVLQCYAIGLAGIALRDIMFKSFYSLKDTKTPTINSVYMIIVDLIFSLIAAYFMGLPGLALGTSLGAFFGSFTLAIRLRKKIGRFRGTKLFVKENIKMMLSSIFIGIISSLSYKFLINHTGKSISLLISVLIAMGIYALSLYILRVDELFKTVDSFKRKFKGRG